MKKQQKTDIKTLLLATDDAFDQIDLVDTDELLAALNLSRAQLLDKVSADDEVEACIEDLRTAMSASNWRIWGDGVADDVVNPLYKTMRKHLDTFIELAITAKLTGYAVAEYVYKVDERGALTFDRIINKKGELDYYTPRRDGSLVFNNPNGDELLVNLSVKHLLLTSQASVTKPAGEIQIARIYPALQLRKTGFLYAGQFIKRYAQPYVVAKKGGFENDETWVQKLFGFINGGAMTHGADDDVKLMQLNGDGKAFKQMEMLANARIQKLILGRVKTSDLETGSRAAQETEENTRQDRIDAYLKLLGLAMQHAIDALIEVNRYYGVAIDAPLGLWFEFEKEIRVDVNRAVRDKNYLDSGQVRFTKDYYTQILGFEEDHVELIASPEPDASPRPFSQSYQLSDAASPPALDPQHLDIMAPKMTAILAALANSEDYAAFEKQLSSLDIADQVLVDTLAHQNAVAYVGGDDE